VGVASIQEKKLITLEQICLVAENDFSYKSLIDINTKGFPSSKSNLEQDLREYWEVHDRLPTSKGLVLLNNRIVIPSGLRKQVLNNLHAAHKGYNSMSAQANQTVYWPGMNSAIRHHCAHCESCNQITPAQSAEPLVQSPTPEWLFQRICTDYFESEGQSYLVVVDSFSCWLTIYHFPTNTKADSLIVHLLRLFMSYGVPEEISSDGGTSVFIHVIQHFSQRLGYSS